MRMFRAIYSQWGILCSIYSLGVMDGRCIHRWMETKWGVYHIALKQGKGLGSRKTRVTVNLEEIAQKLTLGWALSLSLSLFSLLPSLFLLTLSLSLALSLSLFLPRPICSYEAITLFDQELCSTCDNHRWQGFSGSSC